MGWILREEYPPEHPCDKPKSNYMLRLGSAWQCDDCGSLWIWGLRDEFYWRKATNSDIRKLRRMGVFQ